MGARLAAVLAGLTALSLLALSAPVGAAQDEPAINALAFYWEDGHTEELDSPTGKVIVETPSPFCPTLPGSLGSPAQETCAPGRIPVWIRQGDYDTPYMLSAVAFDLSLIPIGSDVSKFTVTFLEDERGCEEDESTETDQRCHETGPINVEGKTLQACLIGDIFGDGEARPYNEVPPHRCSGDDPVAKRKEVKAVDKDDSDGVDHIWTFDLTAFAQGWVEEFSIVTGVMITAETPKDFQPNNPDSSDNWRVVLAGPQVNKGVRTKIVYTPGEEDFGGEFDFGDEGGGGFTDTGGGFTTTTGDSGFGSVDTGGGVTPPGGDEGAEAPPATEAEQPPVAAEPTSATEPLPGYVWLGILAGLVGFSLVRSVVLESAAGMRPNGVLAQIRSINTARRGAPVAATAGTSGGALVALRNIASSVANRVSAVPSTIRSHLGRK
ncbi:MAG: hypothetical protein ACRDKB_09655 [Actinomycetota bacterium]